MSNPDILLWVLLAINTMAYRYIGRSVISQPVHNRPRWAWSPAAVVAAGILPPVAFAALIIAGFLAGDSGWGILVASIATFVVFAVRPDRGLI